VTNLTDAQAEPSLSTISAGTVALADNLTFLRATPSESIDLIYIDPPFNTGISQTRRTLEVSRDQNGDRTGFQGKRYSSNEIDRKSYSDSFEDYLGFLEPRLVEAHRVLKDSGSLYFHIDYRESHYCKILLDSIFGRESFLNEIIWAYDYGARSKSRWPAKHDNIFWYAKNPANYAFDYESLDRIPYMAPGLVGPEKAERGKTPTDVWWHTIVPTNGSEKTGYPSQKPLGIIRRIVKASSGPGDTVLDFFAGSGTCGVASAELGRKFILVDSNPTAIDVIAKRFAALGIRADWVGLGGPRRASCGQSASVKDGDV